MELWDNIEEALFWMKNYGDSDKDEFIEYEKKNPLGLDNQGWKDSKGGICHPDGKPASPPIALVEVQGYFYNALEVTTELAYKLRRDFNLASKLEKEAQKLKEKFNKEFWMEDEGYFALALDGNKNQVKAITSNPGHLLSTGIVEGDKIEKVKDRLFEKDLYTPYGIRTLSMREGFFDPRGIYSYHNGPIWSWENEEIHRALKGLGYHKEASRLKRIHHSSPFRA